MGIAVPEAVTQLDAELVPDKVTLGDEDSVPVLHPEVVVDGDGEGESVEVTHPDALTEDVEDTDTLAVSPPVFDPVTEAEEVREPRGEDEMEVVRDPDGQDVEELLCDTLGDTLVVVHKLGEREPEVDAELDNEVDWEGDRVPVALYVLLTDTLPVVDSEGVKVVEIVKLFVAEGVEDPDTLGLGEGEPVVQDVGV